MTSPFHIAEYPVQPALKGTLQERLKQTLEPFVYGLDTPQSRRQIRDRLRQTIGRYLVEHGESGHNVQVGLASTAQGSLLVYASTLTTADILRRVSGLAMPGILISDNRCGHNSAVETRDHCANGWLFQ